MIVESIESIPTTPQDIFNHVATHLLTQNEVCMVDYDCKYHHNGKACAAGCLIPDSLYSEDDEGYDFFDMRYLNGSILAYNNLRTRGFPELSLESLNLISRLQNLHDNLPIEQWKSNLRKIAEEFNLYTSCLD